MNKTTADRLTAAFAPVSTTLENLAAPARYAIASVCFAAALAARFMLTGVLPAIGFPFLTFFPAVMVSAFLVGLGPGVWAAILSVAAAGAFFIERLPSTGAFSRGDTIALIFFACVLLVDCVLIHFMKGALAKVRHTGRQLRASERSLQQADRHKDIFIATLAHELRNPLAAIRSAVHVIQAHGSDLGPAGRVVGIIERQSAQLARLVEDLLDVSRIGSGKLNLYLAPADLRGAVDAALESCAPWIEKSRHRLRVQLPAEPVMLDMDHARMVQSIGNLLHNAVKFTPAGGAISVTLAREADGAASLRVKDNGRGIDRAMLPKLFAMFAQEGTDDFNGGMNSGGGLGIGLALTRQLVEMHGGQLLAHSDGVGCGAEFTIMLPAAPEIQETARPAVAGPEP